MDAIEIIAHRGSSATAPENTLLAANLAWDEGADAVEGDFRLTRDGHIVAVHDDTLERTAGLNKRVADLTLDELRSLDAGSWKDPSYAGEPVATLDEMLATVRPSKRFYVEIKCGAEIIGPLARAIKQSHLRPAQIVLICIDPAVVATIKNAIPQCAAYWVVDFQRHPDGSWRPQVDEMLCLAKDSHLDGLDLRADGPLTADLVREIHTEGLRVCVWTVDDPQAARRLIELGVEGITTNRPGWLREQLKL